MSNPTFEIQLAGLRERVRAAEELIAQMTGRTKPGSVPAVDCAIVDEVAEALGAKGEAVRGTSKVRETVGQRRAVVRTLRERLHWSWARIARALGKSEKGVRRFLW